MAKQFCAKCRRELESFRMVLMMGPLGFRRYAVCERCAVKLGAPAAKRVGRQRKRLAVSGER